MMEIWDLESRVTSGSRETLDDLDFLPLDHGSHQAYRGSTDVLGLEVPSMELWDEHCGPNDGFGFCGGTNGFIPPKKWKEVDDSSSSGIHGDAGSDTLLSAVGAKLPPQLGGSPPNTVTAIVSPSNVTHVKSVDDYGSPPKEAIVKPHRRYRKRTKHGRFATADGIDYCSPAEQLPGEQAVVTPRGSNNGGGNNSSGGNFQRHTPTSRSLNLIPRDDYLDKGSVTNFFVAGDSNISRNGGGGSRSNNINFQGGSGNYLYNSRESVFPYGKVKVKSNSCDELTPRQHQQVPVDASLRSTSQVLYEETTSEGSTGDAANSNRKGGSLRTRGHRRKSSLFNAVSWLGGKSTETLDRNTSKSCESVNAYVPDDPSDLKAMTNVKVIAIENYSPQGAHELSFKKGQKLKLKSPAMDGQYAFGWKRNSRLGPKKYGYFPLSHVKLYEK